MEPTIVRVVLTVVLISLLSSVAWAGRDGGGYYSTERVANLRANVERFDWARAQRDAVVSRAARWVAMSDEELWRLVPCQTLPRAIDVTMTKQAGGNLRLGCLVCGEEIFKHGNYPYKPDHFSQPWKLTCPSCGSVFPTNDFGAFYASAIDERGCFDAGRGDRSLLFNTEHPDPNDPLHTWGVDDGWGFVDADGHEHRFIAYYAWQYWRQVYGVIGNLAEAWLYTGDPVYAHKAGLMLDRIADVYPAMDWAPYAERGWFHSDGGSGRGKIEGRIWETGVIQNFARYYDMVADALDDDPELLTFLAGMAQQYDLPGEKGTVEDLYRNLEEGILRTGAEALISQQIRGNQGMHQSAMAHVAMAFGRDPEMTQWLDWIFAPDGGAIPGVIVGQVDRDGVGAEGAPSYSLGWASNIGHVADVLAEFEPYDRNDIYRDFPPFAKTFTAGYNLVVLGLSTPNIGDCGATGSMGKVQAAADFIARGYRFLRDPEIALAAYRANGNTGIGLQRDIFDADPEAVGREIEAIGAAADGEGTAGGFNRAGYGLMSLERGAGADGTALWMYYGRSFGHGHPDRLNVGLYAYGLKLEPDLGYPEFATAWPHRNEWNNNTIAHNTVVVDRERQKTNWGGHPVFFKTLPGLSAGEVRSENVYPQCDTYARTVALVGVGDAGEAYALDIFRVRGGSEHLLSFHATPGDPEVTGLQLVEQVGGTYAGPDVPFGARQSTDIPLGFSWLYDVARDAAPPDAWSVDWHVPDGYRGASAADDIHLRYHHLTPSAEVALAHGDPPQNKAGNPRRLRYVLARRAGEEGLTSTFVSVHEPWRAQPLIRSVQRLDAGVDADGFDAVAVRIELADGATDYLVSCRGDLPISAGDLRFAGRLGLIRMRDGQVERAALIGGTELALGEFRLTVPEPAFTGTVVRMDRDMESDGHIWVDADLPTDGTLAGQSIIIENDEARNACYTIEAAERDGELTMLNLGRVSFVRDFADRNDYSAGYVYNFEEGAAFTIPHHVLVQRRADNVADVATTAPVGVTVEP